jgi:hypothetical protein
MAKIHHHAASEAKTLLVNIASILLADERKYFHRSYTHPAATGSSHGYGRQFEKNDGFAIWQSKRLCPVRKDKGMLP